VRSPAWARIALFALFVFALVGLATRYFVREPLDAVPDQLLGRWLPVSSEQDGVFLRIEHAALEWSAGPDHVERRDLLGTRRVEHAEGGGDSYALHFAEEGQVEVLQFELGANGRAQVGGRRSVEWRREAEP
jgi:hypothetical protein